MGEAMRGSGAPHPAHPPRGGNRHSIGPMAAPSCAAAGAPRSSPRSAPPAPRSEIMTRLFQAGADVFRLNFSHGTHEDHAARFAMIRELEEQVRPPDRHPGRRAGPEAARRARSAAGGCILQTGQTFRLDLNATPGDAARVNLPHPEIIEAAAIGSTLLLDDGKLRLRVVHKRADALETEVVVGGPLSDRKGVNVPDVVLPIPALTVKDRDDLEFAVHARRQLHRPVLRAAARGRGRGQAPDRRPRLGDGEAGKAAGAGQPGRDPGADRRGDGGARRPGRRTAARGGAAGAEAHRPAGARTWASRWWWRRRCWKA